MKLQNGEQLIKQQDNAVWVRGKLNNVVGKLVLTNQRLAFEQRSIIQSAILSQFGVAGSLADTAMPRNIVINLPLGQLASFSQVRVVSSRKVLPIRTRSGEELLFSGPKFEQWAPVLMQVGLIHAEQTGWPPNAPNVLPYGQQPPSYGQQQPYSQQQPYGQQQPYSQPLAYPASYAPPQSQTPAKKGIPWWGWLFIAGGSVLLACGVCSIAVLVLAQ